MMSVEEYGLFQYDNELKTLHTYPLIINENIFD